MKNKKRNIMEKIPSWMWVIISFIAAMFLWTVLSINPRTARSFPNVMLVIQAIPKMIDRGVFFADIASSMISACSGFAIGFVLSIPIAFLMAWYLPVRNIIGPWIQFIRNIPALAYVPLIVISAGVGRRPQIIVISLAVFMTSTIVIFQGIVSIDVTVSKAARVLGATDKDIFTRVTLPAILPHIITSMRLSAAGALTTLIAAESTGASNGLGMRIRSLNNTFESEPMLLYIIIIGIIGITVEKLIRVLESRLTRWQEKREI